MDYNEREYLVYKIISGITVCLLDGSEVFIHEASQLDKMAACKLYSEIISDYKFNESFNNTSMDKQMLELSLRHPKDSWWNSRKESEIKQLPKKINNLKLDYYQANISFKHHANIKLQLDKAKKRIKKLYDERYGYYHNTTEVVADTEKQKYLISISCKDKFGNSVFPTYDLADYNSVESVVNQYHQQLVPEEIIRDLCQKQPFISIWNSGKTAINLFGKNGYELNSEQLSLIYWAKTLDNVYESPDKPDDKIIQDVDLLDGWFIAQENKRIADAKESKGESLSKGSGDVFVMVNNKEDAIRVTDMNSSVSKIKQKARLSLNSNVLEDNKTKPKILQKK